MGQSIAGQLNQLPIDMNGQVLTGNEPMLGTPVDTPRVGVGFGMPGGDAAATTDEQAQQMQFGGMPGMGGKGGMPMPGSAPGMGGKGGMPSDAPPGTMLDFPMDPQVNMPQPPQAPPMAVQQGGTPGRPSPAAPMVPRGPGFANPGAPGAPQQQRGILTNPQGQPQPFQPRPQPRLQPAPPAPPVRPVNPFRPAPTVAQPVKLAGRGPGRGAGRGGLLR